jgi:hypothetical protein
MQHYPLPYVEDWKTPLGAALSACEHYCVAACCGMEAYDLKGEHLQKWSTQVAAADLTLARQQAEEVLLILKEAPERFFFLDCEHQRSEVTAWIESVRAALLAVRPIG